MKRWTAPLYLREILSDVAQDGWQVAPISAGVIVWDGLKVFVCSSPSTRQEYSQASALGRVVPRINHWPILSLPSATSLTLGCWALAGLHSDLMLLKEVLKVRRIIDAGPYSMELKSFVRQSETAFILGLRS